MTHSLLRWSKILMTLFMGVFGLLVTTGNLYDPSSNFAFVQHTLLMDTVYPNTRLRTRAISSHTVHVLVMGILIICQLLFSLCCLLGAWQMWQQRLHCAQAFHRAKRFAVLGCLLGLLVWYVFFQLVAGEWFAMWQSQQWNGLPSAARFTEVILGMLIFIAMRNDD